MCTHGWATVMKLAHKENYVIIEYDPYSQKRV